MKITMKLSKTDDVERTLLCASNIMESPIDFPDSAIGSYLKVYDLLLISTILLCRHHNLPSRNFRTIAAVLFILGSQAVELLLEAVVLEHLICPLFIECAAHALISWLHGKNGCATEPSSFPDAIPHHA